MKRTILFTLVLAVASTMVAAAPPAKLAPDAQGQGDHSRTGEGREAVVDAGGEVAAGLELEARGAVAEIQRVGGGTGRCGGGQDVQ